MFSDLAIEDFIEKEYQYDSIEAAPETKRQLRTFSSGERKKAFLRYCISQNTDYIILDNALDHLDYNSRVQLHIELEQLSKKVSLIQIVNRSVDIFPFVSS